MSRDFTPRELYLASVNMDGDYNFLNCVWNFPDGTMKPLYTDEQKNWIKKYPIFGRAGSQIVLEIYEEMNLDEKMAHCVCESIEKDLEKASDKNTESMNSIANKWFYGELDSNFYYRETNDAQFLEWIQKEVYKMRNNDLVIPKDFGFVKTWYTRTYPTDTLGLKIPDSLTFDTIYEEMQNGIDIYTLLENASDSIVRERVFEELSSRKGVEYETIYDMWLKSDCDKESHKVLYKVFDIQWDIPLKNGESYERSVQKKQLPKEMLFTWYENSPIEFEDIANYIYIQTQECPGNFDIDIATEKDVKRMQESMHENKEKSFRSHER